MIYLSYSTINDIYSCGQRWINKQMKLETVDFEFFKAGREIHEMVQDHLSGRVEIPILSEKVDFKKRNGVAEKEARKKMTEKYGMFGKIDYLDGDTMYEIKTGSSLWSAGKFYDLMQWRVYAMLEPKIKKVVFITTDKTMERAKVYETDVIDGDVRKATEWTLEGISRIEKGTFKKLEDKRPCFYCVYRDSCKFSQYEHNNG